MNKKIRYLVDEVPKVSFLLLVGAIILFPMYMMISISFMTPAQLERFPWFPLKMPVPEEIHAIRAGDLEIHPAVLELKRQGQTPEKITVPRDRRFYVHLLQADVDQITWQVTPGTDAATGKVEPAVVAEYRAADVYAARDNGDGTYNIKGEPFEVPQGFVSVMPGLQQKSLVVRELLIVDAAFGHAKMSFETAERAERATDEATGRNRRRDAVLNYYQAQRCLELSEQALALAGKHAAETARVLVSADHYLIAAQNRLKRTRLFMERAAKRIAPYRATYETEAKAEAAKIREGAVDAKSFKVDQAEAVALLRTDRPTTITRLAGKAVVRTEWQFPLRAKRTFTIRPRIKQAPPAGEQPAPGAPLAEMVAQREVDLLWRDGRWLLASDGTLLSSYLLPGFVLTIKDGSEGANGRAQRVAEGTVIARAAMPKVAAEISGTSLIVGLAVEQADGQYHIPLGDGRWAYSTHFDRTTPYAVRLAGDVKLQPKPGKTGDRESDTRIIAAAPGELVAEYYVNRRRAMKAKRINKKRKPLQWVTAADGVEVKVPSGFQDQTPKLPRREATETWPSGKVLAELRMPTATVSVDQDFLVVRMTGAQWSDGQWEYPLGDTQPLVVVKAEVPQMSGDGPWELPAQSDAQRKHLERATERLNKARDRVDDLVGDLDDAKWDGDAAAMKRIEPKLRAAETELAAATREAVPLDSIFEIRTRQRVTLDYVNQQWTLNGRTLNLWHEAESLGRAKNRLQDADQRLKQVRDRLEQSPSDAGAKHDEQVALQDLQWARAHLQRVHRAGGVVPLSAEGEVLSSKAKRAVIEPGVALARLAAEKPHPMSGNDSMTTRVTAAGEAMIVAFAHELKLPVRANIVATDIQGRLKQRLGEGEKIKDKEICRFFTPQQFDLKNYVEAWEYVKDYLANTVIVALVTMVLSIFLASLAAFVFARFSFPGKAVFYSMIIILLMIPGVLNLVPLYVVCKTFGLLHQPLDFIGRLNAILVLVLPAVAGGQVMNIYIMRNNLETLAKDLFDAARIDGASNFQTYWHIAIPLSKPIMGTLAIFALLSQWNNFIWPWVVIREQKYMTVTAGLALLEGQNLSDYGLQMAGAFTASIPLIILFFFMMNLFIRGMQSGAIKA